MAIDLTGAHGKLDRAKEHLNELNTSISRWRRQNPYTFTGNQDSTRTEYRFHVSVKVKPDVTTWGLFAGDCVHNLRSALDHVVWAISGGTPWNAEYPIFLDKSKYLGEGGGGVSGLDKIAGIKDAGVRAVIENSQPWSRRPQGPHDEHLWVLHDLDRNDKHRILTPVLVLPHGLDVKITPTYDDPTGVIPEPLITLNGQPLEDGAEAFAVMLPRPGSMKMESSLTVGVGLPSPSGHGFGGITGTLANLCEHTRRIVEEIGDLL